MFTGPVLVLEAAGDICNERMAFAVALLIECMITASSACSRRTNRSNSTCCWGTRESEVDVCETCEGKLMNLRNYI